MKFWITVPDLEAPLCIQFVKRKDTVYARKCADTMFYPTEAQQAVRDTLGDAAHESSGHGLIALLENVRSAFGEWNRLSEPNQNKILALLMELYPENTEAIINYLKNQ